MLAPSGTVGCGSQASPMLLEVYSLRLFGLGTTPKPGGSAVSQRSAADSLVSSGVYIASASCPCAGAAAGAWACCVKPCFYRSRITFAIVSRV